MVHIVDMSAAPGAWRHVVLRRKSGELAEVVAMLQRIDLQEIHLFMCLEVSFGRNSCLWVKKIHIYTIKSGNLPYFTICIIVYRGVICHHPHHPWKVTILDH